MNVQHAAAGVQLAERSPGDTEAGSDRSPRAGLPLRSTRWLRLRVEEKGESVVSITLPWIICSGALGLTGWLVRCVPRAVQVIDEELPGGAESVDALLRAIRRLPAGTRIEVRDESSYVLIECR